MTAGVSFCSSSSVLRTASSSQCTSSSSNSRSSRGCLFFRSSSSLSSSRVVERDGSRRIGRGKKFVAFASSSSNDDNKTSESLQSSSVFLLGLMGTGKTTVGKKLADALGYGYFDTDQLIEQICKQKVHEIFEEDGEEDRGLLAVGPGQKSLPRARKGRKEARKVLRGGRTVLRREWCSASARESAWDGTRWREHREFPARV